jgi:thermitase
MKNRKWLFARSILVIASLFVLVLAATAGAQQSAAGRGLPGSGSSNIVPGEVLIGFAASASLDQMDAVVAGIGGTVVKKISLPNVRILKVKLSSATQAATDAAVSGLMKTKQTDPSRNILFAEPNIIQQTQDMRAEGDAGIESQTNDPLLYAQWGYYDIAANWIPALTAPAPMIAVIDTGVDYTNPDLIGKVVLGYDYVNADTNPMDDNMHGTHVSGIAAAKANNNWGITGVSWNSKILAIKVLNGQGFGNVFDISLGIIAAANNTSVKVLSMSLGGGYSTTEDAAVDYAVNVKGKLLVAAAGNNSSSTPIYPAGLTTFSGFVTGKPYLNKVLAVAANDSSDCRASFSNYGTWVSITAPGLGILSDLPLSINTLGLGYLSGTSMATPFVSGAAAVAWSKFPTFTNAQIGALLTTDTSDLPLNRDGSCWPADGSTFQKLNIFNVVDHTAWAGCSNVAAVWGFAEDAESGLPLIGAKVVTKKGTSVRGTDYVPYYGQELNYIQGNPNGFAPGPGYGLFAVETQPTNTTVNLSIAKTGYAPYSIPNIYATNCSYVASNADIASPIPPVKPYYWLVIAWNYGSTDTPDYPSYTSAVASYDSYLNVPTYGCVGYVCGAGDLNTSPYALWLWDNDAESATIDLRSTSETVRIKKLLPGTYTYEIYDWWNGSGSTAWGASGIRAYVYKWNGTIPVLVNTITPTGGATGSVWHVLSITGNTVTVNNTFDDTLSLL